MGQVGTLVLKSRAVGLGPPSSAGQRSRELPVSRACPALWDPPSGRAAGTEVSLVRDRLFLLPVGCGFYPRPWWFKVQDPLQSWPGVVMDGHNV